MENNMWEQYVVAFLPLALLVLLAGLGQRIKTACKFQMPNPKDPFWPFAENPGLALELAPSLEFVNKILGKAETKKGADNREAGRRFQKLDFGFIPLYVLFFVAAALPHGGWKRNWVVTGLALLTAIFDLIEDWQILRMLRGVSGSSSKRFGQIKWLFYFATLAAEGSLFFFEGATSTVRAVAGAALGVALILIAAGGIVSALKGSFAGITSATKLSGLGLIALALAPLVALYPHSWRVTAEYVVFLRVPLILGVLILALPFIAFFSGAKTLLRGLFDLTPLSLFVVTLTSFAVAGAVCVAASIILSNSQERFHLETGPIQSLPHWAWLTITMFLSLPLIGFSLWFSIRQRKIEKHGIGGLIIAALCGTGLSFVAALILISSGSNLITRVLPCLSDLRFENWLQNTNLFLGYVDPGKASDPWQYHLGAFAAFVCTSALYAIIGIYGRLQLGKKKTVPALCAALMIMMMLCWMLSALTFFLDAWHIPTLIIVAAFGTLTAQSSRSDHFYHLRKRDSDYPAPDPVATIKASKADRVIVVAANGGGIQAGAWAARVLYGLYEDCDETFLKSLRMISSVSGGSVGNACFVYWLANRDIAKQPDEAAALSSLDEVAWGLAWTDFLRSLVPWLLGSLIGRGRALEQAWCMNSARSPEVRGDMDKPLSNWNAKVETGDLPAVVMNATIAETGERLLLATTLLKQSKERARVDATRLHNINGKKLDVGVVTAARLSASFPYVTPAARADEQGPQPHVVDGGYYDNYGMATLVEWLNEALGGTRDEIKSVMVIQIHGAPVDPDQSEKRHAKSRGWFYQAFAPLTTLAAVRDTGQIAHNEIELEFLQQKWSAAGVPIHSVTFKFSNPDAPLSWHLTPEEVRNIKDAWAKDMRSCRQAVKNFLNGSDSLDCGCVSCKSVLSTH